MDFNLSEQHLAIRALAREFAQREIVPIAQELDEREEFPYQVIRGMADLGLMGLLFPEEYGGSGAGTLAHAIVEEELARVSCAIALTLVVNASLAGNCLYLFANEERKQQWLVPTAQGKILGAFGLTEPGAGSDAGATATTATLDSDEWVINGTKAFITNAGTDISGYVVVTAITGKRADGRKEISIILVPNGTKGYTWSSCYRKLGWHGLDTRELSFADCRVPKENLVGERGAGLKQAVATAGEARIAFAATSVGVAQSCFDLSLSYAQERVQFGEPIFHFQAIQFKLVDMAVNIELARLMTYKAAVLKDEGKSFVKEASMAKLFASEIAVRAAEDGVQIHGGYGCVEDFPVARLYRDAKILTIGEGTSEIQRLRIARYL